MSKHQIQVCFSPAQYSLFAPENATVVVVDVLRATSAMVTAFYHGVQGIIPVATVEEARQYQEKGYIAAAERDGMIVDGFSLGNSPYCYIDAGLEGKTIVITTTNGTKALTVANGGQNEVLVGSFLNISYLAEYIASQQKDVLVLCAGWKDKFNLEDTLFAGALAEQLIAGGNYATICDSAMASMHLMKLASPDIFSFLEESSHRKRLKRLELEEDIAYCLTFDRCPVIPALKGNVIEAIRIQKETQV